MNTQAVIFDIGNVLIEWQPERFFDREIGADRSRAMFAALDLHDMNDRIDKGGPFHATVQDFARANPDWHAEIMLWHDRWLDIAHPAIPRSAQIMAALQGQGMPVFALSNFGIEPFAIAEPVYPFLRTFDRRYISGHMGVTKPDPEIYRMVEDDCGLPPDSLLFIDDRQDNIDAACARGWQVHRFDGADGLLARLVADNLLPEGALT